MFNSIHYRFFPKNIYKEIKKHIVFFELFLEKVLARGFEIFIKSIGQIDSCCL